MTTVIGLTASRMQQIEAASVVDGEVIAGDLILTKHDGTPINAGSVIGPQGPRGFQGLGPIPGEVKLWPGAALPDPAKYGVWVWANGEHYDRNAYLEAANNISSNWNTAMQPAPPAGRFRVPDLRGLVPAGLDAMPVGSARVNRMARAVAITIAAKTGEEMHVVSLNEMTPHTHNDMGVYVNLSPGSIGGNTLAYGGTSQGLPSVQSAGGGQPHETVQPTVMVPYIVFLGP
jgi:hypothetical protein